jgi:large subunit ribosomal protein L6
MAKKQTKKIKEMIVQFELPEGISAEIKERKLILRKDSKEIIRNIDFGLIVTLEGNKIEIKTRNSKKDMRRLVKTLLSHLKNAIEGFNKDFEYELEICNVHFPITVTFDKPKAEFIVKNLLGERSPRIIKAFNPQKVEVEIKAPHIKIKSYDLETAGQNAANLEKITLIRNRDRNKFQDGIFITKKPGKEGM